VDKYEGKRVNSPNDVVYGPDGALYFTDPSFGLPKQNDDPAKELRFNAVFRLAKGKLEPVIRDLSQPNGIAFSPDFKTLYISVSDKRLWMRYDVGPNGEATNGKVLLDASSAPEQDVPDGMKVDSQGNIYATGPGGIWVIAPDGKHLGTIKVPEPPANCAWGDDSKTLYITAVTGLYRIHLNVAGAKAVYN
jgi:gluconolactonase